MKYYTGSPYIQEKIDNNQIKELVLWLYSPIIENVKQDIINQILIYQ